MKVCVTGGAGYIGSVVAQGLLDQGHEVVVVDSLATGHRQAIPEDCQFIEGDVRDERVLKKALTRDIEAVLHFAALSIVGESVTQPLKYFDNNVGGSIQLLDMMRQRDIKRFVFSSTAAVYGDPQELPIVETAPCQPLNPYGHSKLFVEKILETSQTSWGLRFVALRYFNAGGSTKIHGEHHQPESHLMPIVLDVAMGKRERLTIFGDDYDTPDGTCIRDYIHVSDLATAHILALSAMDKDFVGALNLGSSDPFTVMQVVKTVEQVTGKPVKYEIGARRPGDPPALLAASKKAEDILGWKKEHSSLEEIARSAYEWRLTHPSGYDN